MSVFQFGERLPEYGVAVLNEREARAGAGILFFVAIIAFMNAWLSGDFSMTKLVVFAGLLFGIAQLGFGNPDAIKSQAASTTLDDGAVNQTEAERCKVPDFAIALGHADKWKLHNNCQ